MIQRGFLIGLGIGILAVSIVHTLTARAEGIRVESRNYEQSIGSYATNGKIVRADKIQLESEAFIKLFRPRNRGFGSLDLISTLENAARELKIQHPEAELIQIGDTSQEKGGYISGHGSHQNGLDADLVYLRRDRRVMSSTVTTGFDEEFVVNGRVTANFDTEGNWKLISILVGTGRLGRIFVDPNIKRHFCEYTAANGTRAASKEILRKLRPWPAHGDHLHVRLTCPAASPNCVTQAEILAGDGCDSIDNTRDQLENGC